jgi:hypothetical protein
MVCVEALGNGNQVWPFGSSANGCGEAGSDLHRHAGICKGEQDFQGQSCECLAESC